MMRLLPSVVSRDILGKSEPMLNLFIAF
jgi:hypothetical protein